RYGEEFAELLTADLAERPRSAARTADVIRAGLVARLADAGLCGCAPQVPELARAQARAGLASLACCAAVFLGVGDAIWSQLVIGWQWSAPASAGTAVATFVMTGTVLVLALLALLTLLAALPVAWTVATRLAGGRARGLAVPSALFLAGLVIMIVGGRHFGNGWPGTGGHPWARTGLVPGGVAAFCWACTLSVSSFWAHPAALAAFPAAELTWMALSPLTLAWLVTGAATTVRRAELSPALLRFEGRLGVAACVTMAAFLGGGCAWLAGRTAPPGSPFRPGAIDVAGLAVMALALAVARQALRQARTGAR
ncbi:MAG TPA: hypothetical protein VK584_19575, partial [Streptosporangiaceae bacterium]|nr:hypothetical protein [Streptosporangiaceae bacterium]